MHLIVQNLDMLHRDFNPEGSIEWSRLGKSLNNGIRWESGVELVDEDIVCWEILNPYYVIGTWNPWQDLKFNMHD